MEINTDKIAKQCIEEINHRIKNLKKLNIIVVGKSGVGKSTLINSLFRENLAQTGIGRPVTKEIRKLEKKDYPLSIYDTPGFELSSGQQNNVKDEVIKIIEEGYASKDINKAIHCIWYCVNVGGNRTFDATEIEWLQDLTEKNKAYNVPIIVVLTQGCPKSKALEMKQLIEKENLDIVKVVTLLAQDMDFDGEYVAKAYGLDTLIEVMSQVLPDELQDTLQNVQKASLDQKRKRAQATIAAAVATAFGEGFAPIPFADAAVLVPTQVTMIAGITVIYGLDINKSLITSIVSSTIGSIGATVLGRTIVSNVFKLIPGVGTIAGGAISGGTAAVITTALGEAYIQVLEAILKGELKKEDLETRKGQDFIKHYFKKELKKGKK